MFYLLGVTYVLRFSKFQISNFSRFHHRQILWKRSGEPIVLDSKNWFARNTKIPRRSIISQKYRNFFKNMFDSAGFTYVLRLLWFSDLQFLKIPPPEILWTRSEKPIVLDPPEFDKNKFHLFDVRSGRTCGHFEFPKWWDMKNNMF